MSTPPQQKKVLKRIAKIIGWIFLSLLSLLIILIIAVRIPTVQARIVQVAVSFLQGKIGTPVRVKAIVLSFPKKIVISDLYVEDQLHDTLLFASVLSVDVDMWALINKTIIINKFQLDGSKAFVIKSKQDTSFNFDYIVKAFVSPSGKSTGTTEVSAPWKFSIETVEINKTSLLYHDHFSGDSANLKIGSLEIDMDKFDLDKSVFKAGLIDLKDSKMGFQQSPVMKVQSYSIIDSSKTLLPKLDFDKIHIERVDIYYDQAKTNESIQLLIGEFLVKANDIDLNKQRIDLDAIELSETSIVLQEASQSIDPVKLGNSKSGMEKGLGIPWNISLSKGTLSENTFQYDNANAPVKTGAVDFNHLLISFLNIKVKDVIIGNEEVNLDVMSASFHEKSGFSIQQFSTDFGLTKNKFDLKDFLLKSDYSIIEMKGNASFTSIDQLIANYEDAEVKFDINKTFVSFEDTRFFLPEVIDSMAVYLPSSASIRIDASVSGSIRNLQVKKFSMNAFDSTSLTFHGSLKGLPNLRQIMVDVVIDRFYTTGYDVKLVLSGSLLSDSIRLPHWVNIKGACKGTVLAPDINIALTSDIGAVDIDGKFNFNGLPMYDAKIITKELNVGRILHTDSTMGNLDLRAYIKGSGNKLENMDVQLDLKVNKFQFNKYDYKDLTIKGSIKKYVFDGNAALKDKNLDVLLTGNLNYNDSVPLHKLKLVVVNADFQALHLSDVPLKARGTVDVKLNTKDFKVINGNMDIRKVAIFNGKSLYMVDSLLFVSLDQKGKSIFSISSDILSGEFKGTFNLFTLPAVMKQHFNHYFSLQDNNITEFKEPQKFSFVLAIKNTDLITEILFPSLKSFTPGTISGAFNSETDSLGINVNLSTIKYSTTGMDSLSLRVRSDKKALNYSIAIKNLALDTVRVDAIRLAGKIEHDSIYSNLQILDSVAKEKYVFGGVIISELNNFRFHFIPGMVKLNYKEWHVPVDNYLQFGKAGIVAKNFNISKETERVAFVTDPKTATIALEFQNLQLANLTHIIAGKVPASGILNGDFKITTKQQDDFNSKFEIHELSLFEKPVGELTFTVTHSADRYNLELDIKGDGSNVKATGYYISRAPSSEFNIEVAFDPLNFQTIEPFTFGHLLDSKGAVTGNLKLTGTAKAPSVRGTLAFKNATFKLKDLNSAFTLENEKISFDETGIVFNDFKIKDEKNNEAEIKGAIRTKLYKDFGFDLSISTNNFQLLNTPQGRDELFFGLVKITTRTRITGNVTQPVIIMNISPSDDTNFTYVVPQTAKTALEQQGIIRWIDKSAVKDPFLATINLNDTIQSNNPFKGIDLSANISLNDKAVLNIVIDPLTGDKLSVQGSSTLLFGIDPSGDMSLSGRYEITKGSYDFSFYKLVKRQFIIEKGGSITWGGDVMRAQLDIRASYTVETSPLELLSSIDPSGNATTYTRVLPFLVYLNIKGQLLTPDISFQLDMPDNKKQAFGGALYSRIQDINTRESDLNKQVFALLILKRFIADNPLDNRASGGVANTARQSVSRILADQLNRLAENVKGVQLTFDLKSFEDYSGTTSGGAVVQTKAQLGVSKQINDRLVVKLSGNVDIEGKNTNSQNNASDYIGDLALEYKITSDGRLRITGFRNSNYDMISGQLVETGVGLIYIKDYNTLKELFKPNAASN